MAYRGAFGAGVDLVYVVSEAGVKEDIVLLRPPAVGAKLEWRFGLALDGLRAQLNPSGSVSFLDPSGKEVYVVPVDVAYERVAFALEAAADGSVELVVRPDEKWLRDPARKFPVVVDPTIMPGKDLATNAFSTVDSDYPTWHFNYFRTANSTCFGQISTVPAHQSYAYVRYDLSAVAGKIVTSAYLRLNGVDCFSAPAWPATLKARPLSSPFDTATVTLDTRPSARAEMSSGRFRSDSRKADHNRNVWLGQLFRGFRCIDPTMPSS